MVSNWHNNRRRYNIGKLNLFVCNETTDTFPTHILQHSSSYIDLIFASLPILVIDSGIHPSLLQNCHHQVMFCKLNLKIEYPPTYARALWDYGKAQIDVINRAIDQCNRVNLFLDKILMNKQFHSIESY